MDSETARIIAQMQAKLDQLMSFDHIAYTPPTAYTPTWTASGTAPAIGNGSLTGRYVKIGKLVEAEIALTGGTTTTWGTGEWNLSLPFVAVTGYVFIGSIYSLDAGTAHHTGVCLANGAGIFCFPDNAGSGYGPTVPFTWNGANGDQLRVTIVYEMN